MHRVIKNIIKECKFIISHYSKLFEDVTDVDGDIDEAIKRLMAAKRALGLVNKLPDSASRTTNRSRIMGNLNKLNALVNRMAKKIRQEIDADFDPKSYY